MADEPKGLTPEQKAKLDKIMAEQNVVDAKISQLRATEVTESTKIKPFDPESPEKIGADLQKSGVTMDKENTK